MMAKRKPKTETQDDSVEVEQPKTETQDDSVEVVLLCCYGNMKPNGEKVSLDAEIAKDLIKRGWATK